MNLVCPWKRSVCGLSEDFSFAVSETHFAFGDSGCIFLVEGHWTLCFDSLEPIAFGKGPELFRGGPIDDRFDDILS